MLIDELVKANMEALKAKDKDSRAALSVVINKYKLQAIEMKLKGKESTDADMYVVISKTIKEIDDEQAEFKAAGRDEKVLELENQKKAIAKYLPTLMSEDEIRNIILGMNDKSIPSVMKLFKEKYQGKVDMGLVNKVARSI